MAEAIILRETGAPHVLKSEQVVVGAPAAGELRIRQTAIGVNFHDVYVRSGSYPAFTLPGVPGIEAAGVVEAVGSAVADFVPGDRIAYVSASYGGYASERLLPASLAVRLPAAISNDVAATVLLKGLTVAMLIDQVHHVQAADVILVHAAAGGVGRLLCQWAAHRGAVVIGTVGNEAKAQVARHAGCAHTILYRDEDFVARVRDITDGRGVDVAYDSVGRDTFMGSLQCLALRGHLVNFGQSSGNVEPFHVAMLAPRSNSLTRPAVFHYIAQRDSLQGMAHSVFDAIARGILTVETADGFSLANAAQAHEALESRERIRPLLLKP